MTFSIVAIDKKTGEIGIATSTKALSCGGIVPFAKADVGGVVSQSYPNALYKEKGISYLQKGKSSRETISLLIRNDTKKDMRQVLIIDKKGLVAGFTGKNNVNYAGHIEEEDFICGGNMLVSKKVIAAMHKSFSKSKGSLADRLIKALLAGEKQGGDKRKRKYSSASLLIVKKNSGPLGLGDNYINLRIDMSENPIADLKKLLRERMKVESFFSKK